MKLVASEDHIRSPDAEESEKEAKRSNSRKTILKCVGSEFEISLRKRQICRKKQTFNIRLKVKLPAVKGQEMSADDEDSSHNMDETKRTRTEESPTEKFVFGTHSLT